MNQGENWQERRRRREYNGPPWGGGQWAHGSGRPGRFLFLRFIAVFGVIALLFFGSIGAIGYAVTESWHTTGTSGPPRFFPVPLLVCGLIFALPALAIFTSVRAFRRITSPLAEVMAAADAVAGGNLNVRVSTTRRGEFNQLAQSFNHMTTELARADEQRRNLTADVAHELRTPLHVIQGNLEGILDGVYEPTEEHIQATLSETRALARLVEDLRTLSLAEGGQLPLAHETVDVADLLADVGTSFSGQAEAAGIDLRVETANGLTVVGDAGRLDQVLSNLVANAIRHTPAGGVVTLRSAALSSLVRLTVSDTGEGIAAADLPFVFDRFWRADPARSHTRGAGSGLGLAIARQLVQAHGGQIGVVSQVGRGTTFTIDLPAQAAPVATLST